MRFTIGRLALLTAAVLCAAGIVPLAQGQTPAPLHAGAHAIDITPTKFPVYVNGGFNERKATRAHDPLHARCLVFASGQTRVAIAVVDTCLMPRTLIDKAKALAAAKTGIPVENMLVSATHTHTAPAVTGALGCPGDAEYIKLLPAKIAEGIRLAAKNLEPARVGHAVIDMPQYTYCRRWILRSDKIRADPFGKLTVRAMMHPGYQNPAFTGPSGPSDPAFSVLAVQSSTGRPIALMGNFAMHYFGGSPMLSADYFGLFARKVAQALGAKGTGPPFVGIMSHGTSGDIWRVDYGRPRQAQTMTAYTDAFVSRACEAFKRITYRSRVPLVMRQGRLTLKVRTPDAERVAWARKIIAEMEAGKKHGTYQRVYSREQIHLLKTPTRELKLQALRIGQVGITAIPCEVYALTGLKLKAQSPLDPTINIELANGADGYIPPPEQHVLGGYNTWAARSACLEVQAEPKIVEAVLALLENVAGKPRRKVTVAPGPYAKAVLADKPLAYWRMADMSGPKALDCSPNGRHGRYEDGVAFYLAGPAGAGLTVKGRINRAAHFAGGRMAADLKALGETCTVELWFWNGMPSDVRPVTGYLFSRGRDKADGAPGGHLGIGGTHMPRSRGRLIFFNGNAADEVLVGKTEIKRHAWHHVVLVRRGKGVTVYLDGSAAPEIAGEAKVMPGARVGQIFIGGRNDNFANFEGKIDEVAVYARALTAGEVAAHYAASRR